MPDATFTTEYFVQFYGETLDGADTLAAARTLRARYVADVWAGRLPDLVTAEDFADYADCDLAFGIVAYDGTGRYRAVS